MAEENKIEPVKQIEIDTKDLVASSRIDIPNYRSTSLHDVFIIPTIEEKVTWMEKDLNSYWYNQNDLKINQSFQKTISVHHVIESILLHSLLTKYPSFSDNVSCFHQRYYTMTTPMPDEELLRSSRCNDPQVILLIYHCI